MTTTAREKSEFSGGAARAGSRFASWYISQHSYVCFLLALVRTAEKDAAMARREAMTTTEVPRAAKGTLIGPASCVSAQIWKQHVW